MFVLSAMFLHSLCRYLFRENKARLAAFLGLLGCQQPGVQEEEAFLRSRDLCTLSASFKKDKKCWR